MSEGSGVPIRPAKAADAPAVAALTDAAYAHYVPRIGRKPMPMLDDHAARISRGEVFVLDQGGEIQGLISLVEVPGSLLIFSIAIAPHVQGRGLGRQLIGFAEDEARRLGISTVQLYTNAKMVENQAIYRHLGFVETRRATEDGLHRVFMEKRLAQDS